MFCIKIHEKFGTRILAICDKDIIEREFEFRDLKIKVSKEFYYEKIVSREELIELVKTERFDVINAFGNEIVGLLIQLNIINEKNILIIGNQKHAILQIL